tara:strand:+ start:181 stop:375 length:195 start_codon:yes stop_codon:yes gene_type:complete
MQIKLLSVLTVLLFLSGCKNREVIQYKKISFADTNGLTTVYYPITMEKDIVPDDGRAKLMLIKP